MLEKKPHNHHIYTDFDNYSFLLAVKSRDYYAILGTFAAFRPSSRSAVRQGN